MGAQLLQRELPGASGAASGWDVFDVSSFCNASCCVVFWAKFPVAMGVFHYFLAGAQMSAS